MSSTQILQIKTLGDFSVSVGDKQLSEKNTRASQLWKLFKYIITNRTAPITTEKLIDVLWPESDCDDPLKALYSLIYRLRATLNQPFKQKQNFILFKHDSYSWNPDSPYEIDAEVFETLVRQSEGEKDSKKEFAMLDRAFGLYRGNYLAEAAFEIWSLPAANYYKRLYSSVVQRLSALCAAKSDHENIVKYNAAAIELDPYEESMHYDLINALINMDMTAQAVAHYNYLSSVLYNELGVVPSDQLVELYNKIYAETRKSHRNLGEIAESLREQETLSAGVFFCDPDVFRKIYQLEVRSIARSKESVFLGCITLLDESGETPGGLLLAEGMSRLKRIVMLGLRRGDTVTQYSDSQLLMLLPTAELENCNSIAERLETRFFDLEANEEFSLSFDFLPLPS